MRQPPSSRSMRCPAQLRPPCSPRRAWNSPTSRVSSTTSSGADPRWPRRPRGREPAGDSLSRRVVRSGRAAVRACADRPLSQRDCPRGRPCAVGGSPGAPHSGNRRRDRGHDRRDSPGPRSAVGPSTRSPMSHRFLAHAREKFAAYEFVRYACWTSSGRRPSRATRPRLDVVVAANVLHATRNLDETLQHVRDLLAPGGLLVLTEATDHPIWFDITIALIGGWQKFADAWREGSSAADRPGLARCAGPQRVRAGGDGARAWRAGRRHGAARHHRARRRRGA